MTPVRFMSLFPEFRADSWNAWRGVLQRLTPDVRELFVIAGRGSGKSRIVALLAACFGSREYHRVAGERVYVGVFGPSRTQATLTFRYIVGLLRSVPELNALIVDETKESIDLANGVTVEVITASTAAPRGRGYALCVVEEAAFLPSDAQANPDLELLRAVRPALARVPGSLLAVIGSPYARRGVLWQAVQRNAKQPDPRLLVVQKPTTDLNPMFDSDAIAQAFADDPTSARAEYGAEFRSDVEAVFSLEAVQACVIPDRHELPPVRGIRYSAFTDPSGGSADSFTLAIAHTERRDGNDVRVLDAIRERVPPFSPDAVVSDFATLLRAYGVRAVSGDRYAGEWPREAFRKYGIDYRPSDRTKSELFRDLLPTINSGRVELLDDAKLIAQLTGLERRTTRGGRDSIDHGPGGHDDRANAVAGALALISTSSLSAVGMFHALTGCPISLHQSHRLARIFPRGGDPLGWTD